MLGQWGDLNSDFPDQSVVHYPLPYGTPSTYCGPDSIYLPQQAGMLSITAMLRAVKYNNIPDSEHHALWEILYF